MIELLIYIYQLMCLLIVYNFSLEIISNFAFSRGNTQQFNYKQKLCNILCINNTID